MTDEYEPDDLPERRKQAIERAKKAHQQIIASKWSEFEAFRPTTSRHENDMLVVSYRLEYPEPIDWTDVTAREFAWKHAQASHPDDEAYLAELSLRLSTFVARRHLNLSRMGCGFGWEDLLIEFLDGVEHLPGFRLLDAVEKWGALSIKYQVENRPDELISAERRAVEQSLNTCEMCGEPGTLRRSGWWKTCCDKHLDFYKEIADPFRETKARYSDVYQTDPDPHTRGLEFKYGWAKLLRIYLDQLRTWHAAGFQVKLRSGLEKSGALQLSTDVDYSAASPLQIYWVERLGEYVRRRSLCVCDMCGKPGRLRWGRFLATRCNEHTADLGEMRKEDGIILDAERQRLVDGKVDTMRLAARFDFEDEELGLNPGKTWDGYKQFTYEFSPMLAPAAVWPDDDAVIEKLRRKLLDVDKIIGPHRWLQFRLLEYGERLDYSIDVDLAYADAALPFSDIVSRQIAARIHAIMRGEG